MIDIQAVEAAARRELAEEQRRAAIDAAKKRLLERRPLWHRLFPFTVTIKRRP